MNATTQSTLIPPPFVPFLPVPREVSDEAWATLSPIGFRVWYYIMRMTRGWQRDEAAISYEEFKEACRIKSIGQISEALKELVSKGFIAVFKHTGPYGAQATSSYFLLNVPAKNKAPSPRSPRAPQPERKWTPPWQKRENTQPKQSWQPPQQRRENTQPAPVNPPAALGEYPPLGPMMCSSALVPDPFEASEKTSARDIHAQLDQVELPCFQESQAGEEEEEAYGAEEEERGEVESRPEARPRSQEEEVRGRLEEMTRQCTQAYCQMVKSEYGTREYQESKQKLATIRADQKRLRAMLSRLEAVQASECDAYCESQQL